MQPTRTCFEKSADSLDGCIVTFGNNVSTNIINVLLEEP